MYKGRIIGLIMVIFVVGLYFYSQYLGSKGKNRPIRKIAALDAIDDAVARSAEMGRPIMNCAGFGSGGLNVSICGPAHIAGLAVMDYATQQAAKYNVETVYTTPWAELIPLITERMEAHYLAAGQKIDSMSQVRYFAPEYWVYSIGVLQEIEDVNPGAIAGMGPIGGEDMFMIEGAAEIGALSIMGSAWSSGGGVHLPVCMVYADHFLFGEELFAGGAYLSKDANMIASFNGMDLYTIILMAFFVLGTIVTFTGSKAIIDILMF